MKKETIGIIILAIVFCFGIGAMLKGRDWDYEREGVKPSIQDTAYKGVDSVLVSDGELCYWPENLQVDSVTYDSNTHVFSVHYVNGNLAWYDIVQEVDWNWFKKGYRPQYVESVNGISGPHISGDTLRIPADTTLWIYGKEDPGGEYSFSDTLRISTFRDTINNSK